MQIQVSPEDEWLLLAHPWRLDPNGYVCFAKGTAGKDYQVVFLHRVICGAGKGSVVDHRDGNPQNNRRDNLRVCTHAENMRNRRKAKSNKSGFKGVWMVKKTGHYVAEIKADGRKYRLGSFRTPAEAARAYDSAARRLHGEFARTN